MVHELESLRQALEETGGSDGHRARAYARSPCSSCCVASAAYITAALTGKFNEVADPKVQLEQAIIEAQDQHRRLKEQAANVIANQKQTEMRLNRAMEELEALNSQGPPGRADGRRRTKAGDTKKATELTNAAQSFANRLITTEKEVESLKQLHLQASQATDQAKAAVQQNSIVLQKKLTERQKLLSQLDQAKMQEQMNKAMSSLSETVGQDVPDLRRGAGQDRAALRQGARCERAAGRDRRGPDARGRAGGDGLRGHRPPLADPLAARPRHRQRARGDAVGEAEPDQVEGGSPS